MEYGQVYLPVASRPWPNIGLQGVSNATVHKFTIDRKKQAVIVIKNSNKKKK